MDLDFSPEGFGSHAIHSTSINNGENAHLFPIVASSTFVFESAEQGMRRFSGEEKGFIYSRFGNPTTSAAASVIAGLETFKIKDEQGEPLQASALLHASGQSAMATMLLCNLSAGDGILSHYSLYGGTHEFIYGFLARLGIASAIEDFSDLNKIEDTLKKNARIKLIHVETPANPTMNCVDLAGICVLAKKYNAKVTVDNTFATPYLQQPFKYGVDFIFHSTTKFLNGHGTSIGGVLVGRDVEFMKKKGYETYKLLGGCASPFDAYLLMQGVRTLEVRMKQHCENAMQVANFLSTHPSIEKVNYNGLSSHPDHALSSKQMRHPGAVMSFELKGGLEDGKHFINSLKMCTKAVSLGTVDTLISHPASMSHSGMLREDRLKSGVTDGLIRMSVGLENINDLLNDLDQALKK
ncbi:MAG: aminotransferase class I/II-fold pyridoxal phosphate-dependent enzyme [Chitinophagaceae bacterium]|nr:aminotransferase class I/II-fold pyridoxal phosphate-dependent enzyme [Chitinophagaceae bacterium]